MRQTGKYYYGARYYNPKWSTWLSVDPLVEQTMDAYGYCYRNPVNLTDPDGRSPKPPHHDFLISVAVDIYDFSRTMGASVQGSLLILGQASIESGYGSSALKHGDYNLFGVMGKPSKRSTSHGTVKDYSRLGGYGGAMCDYYNKLKKTWPDFINVLEQENISSDDVDRGLNTGSYFPTDKERMKGKYAYNADKDSEGKNNYGFKLLGMKDNITKRFSESLSFQIGVNEERINSLYTMEFSVLFSDQVEAIREERTSLQQQNHKFKCILNEIE